MLASHEDKSVLVDLSQWKSFDLCPRRDLNCSVCLGLGGQSFTWETLDDFSWFNVLSGICVIIRSHPTDSHVKAFVPSDEGVENASKILSDYFRLNWVLDDLCKEWRGKDPKFPKSHSGIRLLRQNPLETILAFICSQNNVITRIKSLVLYLKHRFGFLKAEFQFGQTSVKFFAFPETVSDILKKEDELEAELRAQKFGYRARYIPAALNYLQCQKYFNNSDLMSLRQVTYDECVHFLREIPGVGPKVADCIALMSLDQLDVVPIDTHIWRIARDRYNFSVGQPKTSNSGKTASLNNRVYRAIGDKFRDLFGPLAGWAHSLLFTAELRTFKK